jgi:hypothetical protein
MLRSKKVRSSRKLDELGAKEAEDEKVTKKKIKRTRSSLSLGKHLEDEGGDGSKKEIQSAAARNLASSSAISTAAKKSSSSKQKIKVQFEIVFVSLRNLPAKMQEDGSSVLVRWKSSTKKKIVDASGVRSKAETQAVEVKAGGKAGWAGVGGGSEGERFLFEEKLKYNEAAKSFDSKSIELVLKEVRHFPFPLTNIFLIIFSISSFF